MSVFGKILNKLGIKKDKPEEKEKKTVAAKPAVKKPIKKSPVAGKQIKTPTERIARKTTATASAAPKVAASAAAASEAMEMVDVMSKLESMSKGSGLNWTQSIVDLLKVLGIDSSLSARKELAKELACPEELMGDSAKMNTWLHKTVLQKIAENGGNVPQNLLD